MKEVWKAAAACMAIFMLTGCSSREDKEQYLQPPGLEPLRVTIVDLDTPEKTASPEDMSPAGEQTDPKSSEREAAFQAEVTGTEEESVMTVSRAAEVYNHPSEDGSKIGSVRRGESVSAIGPTDSGDWYMIEYNGRVAYVEADVIAGREQAAASTPARSPSPVQTTPPEQPSQGQQLTGIPSSLPEQSAGQQPSQGPSGTTNPKPTVSPMPGPTMPPAPTASPSPGPAETASPTQTPTQPPSPEPTDTVTPTEIPTQPPSPEPTETPPPSSEPGEEPATPSEPTEEPTAPPEPTETPPPSSEPGEEPATPSEPTEPTETATPTSSLPDIEPS